MADKIDIAIIGAGVIGLAVAAEIGRDDKDIFILEKNSSFGEETSSRNSEVIHAGIYYPKDTLKAVTCVEGNKLLYEICEKNNIFCQKIGKLIIATCNSEIEKLEELLQYGKENEAFGLSIISEKEIRKIEPKIKAKAALYSPSTGIIDTHELMKYFLQKAGSKGVEILYETEVVGIKKVSLGYEVRIIESGEETTFISERVINCAGLNSDLVAQMLGIDIENCGYTLKYCKGTYFQVYKPHSIKHLIYPVPSKISLGIHVVLDKTSRIRLGPDAEYIEKKINYDVDLSKKTLFYDSVKKFLPFIGEDDLSPDMAGIRPKLQGPKEDFRDFIIRDEKDKGYSGFINLIGIESPGLTASPAIAKYVQKLIE
ncbi:MAG: NAD(P)/FAD-dependent oxidoreductase [bacterium]|nr:NAD(P)/FAD-dependent oxidoreductase [bacterium]